MNMHGPEGRVSLLSIGLGTPERTLGREAAVELGASIAGGGVRRGVIEALHRRGGVEQRGIMVLDADGRDSLHISNGRRLNPSTSVRLDQYTEHASALAHRAAADALGGAGIPATRITHIVTVSCTGFEAPGFDQAMMRSLGLRGDVRRTHIGYMGCHAGINGLAVARAFAASDPDAVVLLCCVELCSLHFHCGTITDRLVANSLFGDGAAAAVIAPTDSAAMPSIAGFASRIIPETGAHMRWRIGDHGFEMSLSNEVPEVLGRIVPGWVDSLLAARGLTRAQVGGWAIHPGGPRIVRTVISALGLNPEAGAASLGVLRDHGNMSSPTILFVLRRLWEAGTARPWVGMAFGPGLAAEGVVFR